MATISPGSAEVTPQDQVLYETTKAQLQEVGVLLNLDPAMVNLLAHAKRELIVHFLVRMDDS